MSVYAERQQAGASLTGDLGGFGFGCEEAKADALSFDLDGRAPLVRISEPVDAPIARGAAPVGGLVLHLLTPGYDSKVRPTVIGLGSVDVVDFKAIHWDLPILEYRPYRAFDTKQSSAVLIQLYAGAEIPNRTKVTWPPGAPGVKLENIYSIGVRFIFDWRHYF